jgi:hypothetical protein
LRSGSTGADAVAAPREHRAHNRDLTSWAARLAIPTA